jgi:hypothetical protein
LILGKHRQGEEPRSSFLCSLEVRDAAVRWKWKAGELLGLEFVPNSLSRLVLIGEFHGIVFSEIVETS